MPRKMSRNSSAEPVKKSTGQAKGSGQFHIEFKNEIQGHAWAAFNQHDVLFLVGKPGTGKTHLAMAFAIEQLLSGQKSKIVLTRPIVEAGGEKLGFLPGEFEEKVHPYMVPLYDCLDYLVGRQGMWRDKVLQSIEVAPLAYMRGRTFRDAICIFDEAQNAAYGQLKLFLSRFDEKSKLIITGDPSQTDLPGEVAMVRVMHQLRGLPGVGMVEFKHAQNCRHPLVAKMMERLEGNPE